MHSTVLSNLEEALHDISMIGLERIEKDALFRHGFDNTHTAEIMTKQYGDFFVGYISHPHDDSYKFIGLLYKNKDFKGK